MTNKFAERVCRLKDFCNVDYPPHQNAALCVLLGCRKFSRRQEKLSGKTPFSHAAADEFFMLIHNVREAVMGGGVEWRGPVRDLSFSPPPSTSTTEMLRCDWLNANQPVLAFE